MSSSSEALLDHIVDFLKFISSAQSFWFSLDTSYDNGCEDGFNPKDPTIQKIMRSFVKRLQEEIQLINVL